MTDNHSELLESFKAISAVLERHGVTYYGVYGTAIGAVRHNGFIPWDDDLDIGIFAKDLDLVSKILKEELDPDKFYYHQPSADSHPHVIYKGPDFEERLKNRSVSFIDIFIFLDYPDSKIRRALSYPFTGFELLSHKIIEETNSNMIKGLFYKVLNISRKTIRLFSQPDTKRVCLRDPKVSKNSWERADFGTPIIHKFEDTTIPLPCNYHKYLTEFYGDYMTPPPEDQRAGATGYPYNLLQDYLEDQRGDVKHHRISNEDLPY